MQNFARLGIVICVLTLAACGGNGAGVQFDSSVPSDQRSLIEGDLSILDSITLPPAQTNDLATIGVGALTPIALNDWLSKRTKLIVGEDFSWKQNASLVNRSAPTTPFVMAHAQRIDPSMTSAAKTVMWNLGSYLYLDGKDQGHGYYLDVDSTRYDVYTPRVGIVQIGEGLFTVNSIPNVAKDRMVNSYLRLGTYFHEGRHSDGNGTNAGFPHAKCPSGDYKDLYACEDNLNGPYAIQSILLGYMYQACTDCTAAEREGLALSLADYKSRLLPSAQYRDSRPEGIK